MSQLAYIERQDFDGLGHSAYTPVKQAAFAKIVAMHLNIAHAVMQRDSRASIYRYFDLNAGPGRYHLSDGTPITGSPLIFLQKAAKEKIPHRAVLIERCSASCQSLEMAIGPYSKNAVVVQGDHNGKLISMIPPLVQRYTLGLIYSDPTNHEVPFNALIEFCRIYPRIEVLIHVAATAIKRTRNGNDPDLLSRLKTLNKNYWLVREPESAWQWTFLMGTNWGGETNDGKKRGFKDYRAINFYRMDTQRGLEIIEKLTYTKTERAQLNQLPLSNI